MKLILSLLLFSSVALANGETTTPNMNLVIPAVGVTLGPQWASDINAALALIDAHDHSPGKGVPINASGMNIDSDLSFQNNSATNLASVNFTAQSITPPNNSIFESGVDLFFVDGNGNIVRLTQSGSVIRTAGTFNAYFSLEDATVPYIHFGQHFQAITQVLSSVNMAIYNSGLSGSTTIKINQFRGNSTSVPLSTATASISSSGGNPNSSSVTLSVSLNLIAGDILTIDLTGVASGSPEGLTVEY